MNRKHLVVKISRFLLKFPFQILRPVEQFLLTRKHPKTNSPIIIILSLPRSGSTLTYQAIAHRFKVYYLSNLSHFFYKIPYIGYLLTRNHTFQYYSDFYSSKGFVKGLMGPAEGFHFWNYWFRCTLSQKETLDNEKLNNREKLLLKIFKYISVNSRPILTAYLGHIFCFNKLNSAFPNAVFIRLRRNPVDVISSIMNETPDEIEKVFSLRPAELNPCNYSSKLSKVSAQVYYLNKKLDNLNNRNIFDINYEDLCKNPNEVLNNLKMFCKKRSIYLEDNNEIQNYFLRSAVLDSKIRKDIKYALDNIDK
ncbi:MAG: hypothetical protein RIR51_1648 [Bacteroidota bacterium]